MGTKSYNAWACARATNCELCLKAGTCKRQDELRARAEAEDQVPQCAYYEGNGRRPADDAHLTPCPGIGPGNRSWRPPEVREVEVEPLPVPKVHRIPLLAEAGCWAGGGQLALLAGVPTGGQLTMGGDD